MKRTITCVALLLTTGILAMPGFAQEEISVETPAGTQHEMVLVPAGSFIMGADDGLPHERPRHTVFLNAYYIDRYEVTVAQFRACVEAGACEEPASDGGSFWGKPGHEGYPISALTWDNADGYCQWAGLRLPTEAEWEKAARGTDGRTNPWGEGIDESKASYGNVAVSPVGSFPDGASPYGAMDMAGNMWEMVADWYAGDAYLGNGLFNPVWVQESDNRIVRGGSSHSPTKAIRSSFRTAIPTDGISPWGSFRCGRDASSQTSYPRFGSASVQSDGAVAGRLVALEAEVILSQPMEESGFSDMSVGLSPAGVDEALELEHLGAGRYVATGRATIPFSGHYQLPVRVTGPDDQRHLVGQLSLLVWPAANQGVFTDQLADAWTTTERKMAQVDPGQTEVVHSGQAAIALRGEKSFAGWQVVFEAPEPLGSVGYVLRFHFHPGESMAGTSTRLAVSTVPGAAIDLMGVIELERREWQLVEIALEDFEPEATLTGLSFSGTLEGIFYLDDIELLATEPPPPAIPTAGAGPVSQEFEATTPAGTNHEMVLVPAGPFPMGVGGRSDVVRPHTVFVDGFYVDRFPVTNAQWNAFARAEGREARVEEPWAEPDAEIDRLPARQTWFDARDYCAWAGLRLPTEAEWEKAGRGTDGRTYPWGEGIDHSKASYGNDPVMPVGSWPDNVSPYGVRDMTGNLWEWAADWFGEDYYSHTPLFNPTGPEEGTLRILKGGGNQSPEGGLFLASRFHSAEPTVPYCQFRCVREAEDQAVYPRQLAVGYEVSAALVGQPATVTVEVQLDRPLEGIEPFEEMILDLSSIGVTGPLPLEHSGGGHYSATGTVTPLRPGRHELVVAVRTAGGEQYPTARIRMEVWPAADVGIYDDRLAFGWTATQRNLEAIDMTQSAQVFAGSSAGAIQGKKSFAGWQVLLEGSEPVEAFGYALSLAFHPGEMAPDDGARLSVSAVPGSGVDLLEWVDLDRKEWQAVAIPMARFEMKGPMTGLSFSGTPAGTWYLDEIRLVADTPPAPPTAVVEERGAASPATFALQQSYPNPFNSSTVIGLALPAAGDVELAVYNAAGQKVATLLEGRRSEGVCTIRWDGRDDGGRELASGVYTYRLRAGERVEGRKLLLLR